MEINEFFHVACIPGRFTSFPLILDLDRSCIELPQYGDHEDTRAFKELVKEYFPEGLSHFGKDYLLEQVRYESVNNISYIENAM